MYRRAYRRAHSLVFKKINMNNSLRYFVLGVIFWIVVDYTTAFNPDFQRWLDHMPEIWLFYLGYPLLFTFLIYKKGWTGWKLFLPMLLGAFVVEVIFTHNVLLYTFPIMLVMIPIALCIYGFITYTPKWIVEKKILEHKILSLLFAAVWVIVSFLSFITRSN